MNIEKSDIGRQAKALIPYHDTAGELLEKEVVSCLVAAILDKGGILVQKMDASGGGINDYAIIEPEEIEKLY
jgi:hypothetical protein